MCVLKCREVKAHWFDQWDLGKTHARLSLPGSRSLNRKLHGSS